MNVNSLPPNFSSKIPVVESFIFSSSSSSSQIVAMPQIRFRLKSACGTVAFKSGYERVGMENSITNETSDDVTDLFADTDIGSLRKRMLRFATLQLRDASIAEDAVQEALIAAHSARHKFEGRSKMETWCFSILRNKIIDIQREHTHRPTHSLAQEDEIDDAQFDENGRWRKEEQPSNWGQPETAFSNEQFWQVFENCLSTMAENTARVFMMRELSGLTTTEICSELEISESNCWVILHRARSNLRVCLEEKWIKSE